jgi:hypothetical protein
MYGPDTECVFRSFEAKLDMAITAIRDALHGAELVAADASNRKRLDAGHASHRLSWGVFIGTNKVRRGDPTHWELRLSYEEPWGPCDPQVLRANLVNRNSGENRSIKVPVLLEEKIVSESFAKFIISTMQSVVPK